MEDQELTAYELERQQRLEENKRRMQELGLPQVLKGLRKARANILSRLSWSRPLLRMPCLLISYSWCPVADCRPRQPSGSPQLSPLPSPLPGDRCSRRLPARRQLGPCNPPCHPADAQGHGGGGRRAAGQEEAGAAAGRGGAGADAAVSGRGGDGGTSAGPLSDCPSLCCTCCRCSHLQQASDTAIRSILPCCL